MFLDDIVAKRREQLAREKATLPLVPLMEQAFSCTRPVLDFASALKHPTLSVIAEIKKASPSKGLICPDFHPAEIARAYTLAGANAISCLTEEHYFQGSSTYLQEVRAATSLPILRKDFIIDPYQIYEARILGADAVLLICALLDTDTLRRLMHTSQILGLHTLVEAHNEEELASAIAAQAPIIGINNRNLKTFEVDLHTTAHLANRIPYPCILVSESGITSNSDMKIARENGADAVLIGETLMRSEDIVQTLVALREDV